MSSPDGRGLPVPLTNEAARAVFEIGRRTEDFVLRSRAWYVLGRTSPDAEFARAWIDDLERHPDENVRGAAAAGLAQHSGDAAVRAALERASVEDASQNVRRRALAALQGVNR